MDASLGKRDTIAAIATPAGAGGVGIVRISGASAPDIAAALLDRGADRFPDRQLVHGTVRDADGARLDDVLAVVMRAPRSYTGEHVAEIHGHGGAVNMARLLRAVIAAGARHAEPGEFTRRAFANGQIDLARAEAIVDVITASSERAWRLAQAQLGGGLGQRVAGYREQVTALLAEVEACIDFPEEGETYLGAAGVAERAATLSGELSRLAGTFSLGRALRDGIEVAVTGPVNSGKSSIFNRLIGSERAIVAAEPGTTRDFVEARVVWEGVAVTLIDTAGERTADSEVERKGIELGRQRAAEADLRLVTHAADLPPDRVDRGAPRTLHVMTKGDLLTGSAPEGLLVTSAVTGQGVDALEQRIVELVCGGVAESDDGFVVTSERQRTLLEQAAAALGRAATQVAEAGPVEVLAIEVREAAEQLAGMTGERVDDEVLDVLFARFCIGK